MPGSWRIRKLMPVLQPEPNRRSAFRVEKWAPVTRAHFYF
jgi:hypothetical protein